jgi:hypothetical protein
MSIDYALAFGTHATPEEGRCAMEWVSHLAGEPHGDQPACVSPVLRAFCTTLNDSLEDRPRQRLRPYLTRTIGTADDGLDESRAWMALDWLIRTYVPAWLRAARVTDAATRIDALRRVDSSPALRIAVPALEQARRETNRLWAATLSVPRTAVRAAPWAAGRSAARDSAWACAAAATWSAARLGIRDVRADQARRLAREIAGDTAAATARRAPLRSTQTNALDALHAALEPTVSELRRSAFALLDRMLPTVPLALPALADAQELSSPVAL